MGDGLYQQQGCLHGGEAFPHHLHHVVAEAGLGLVEAGGVQKDKLGIVTIHHAVNTVAGGLGLLGHDGDFLAYQCIGEAGLAHVGAAADGDHGGFGNVRHR